MGPLRRGLILTLFPGAAWAEVCDEQRPNWDGTPTTALTEAIALFSSPLGLILIICTGLAWRYRSAWGGLAMVVGWTGFVTMVVQYDPEGLRASAIAEGCIGPPTLFIALAIAICIATVLFTAPRIGAATHGE